MTDPLAQPYQRIVEDVRDQIRLGRLRPDDKLPSTRELATHYGVAHGTVQRALTELRASGLIYSHQGKGSFVRQVPLDEPEATSELQELREQVSALAARLERVEQAVFQKT
ncbi:winged helix-turn-helix domain-containing protein [Kitasatospora sp. NPDC028055]|uniref:GntR family transcriptional regulator n=1 Tax=Kitasatospora sp. NPDC028055 TaxID=3155653 RepID=UPI0034068232